MGNCVQIDIYDRVHSICDMRFMYQVTQESQYNKTMVLEQLKYCHNSACVICSRILLCQIRTATLFTPFASLEKWALFLQHTTIFFIFLLFTLFHMENVCLMLLNLKHHSTFRSLRNQIEMVKDLKNI